MLPPRAPRVSGHRHNQAGRILATDDWLRRTVRGRFRRPALAHQPPLTHPRVMCGSPAKRYARYRTEKTPAPVQLTIRGRKLHISGENALARAALAAAFTEWGFMRDVSRWIRGKPANTLKSNGQLPAGAVLRAPINGCIPERANHGLLVTRGTERSIDDPAVSIYMLEDERAAAILFIGSTTEPSPVAAPQVSETDIAAKRFAGGSMFVLDAESGALVETLSFSGQKKRPRTNRDLGRSDVRDSSPHARLLRQARSRVQELATANRRKDEFLAMLSHELRSPLAAIQNAVCILSGHWGEAPARQRAQALIERQVRGMTQLVDDLMDLS